LEPQTAGGEGAGEQHIAPCCPPAVVTWQALHLLAGTNTKGQKISNYPNQRRAVFTVSSFSMFLSGPHPPDALSLQEKRETESVMKEGRTHMRRGKKKTLRHPTWPRTEGARRARERGGVGVHVRNEDARYVVQIL